MKDRSRRVPPPPPPPEVTRPDSRLPALRPRRLDSIDFGARSDQSRRAVRLPELPEKVRKILQEVAAKYSPPVPAAETRRLDRGEALDDSKGLNIPVICTKTDRAFILLFREPGGLESNYRLESVRPNIKSGTDEHAELSITVPVDRVDWSDITCPHCRNRVQPVLCSACNRLACDGRVTKYGGATFFKCAPSCGCSGQLYPNLKNVTGSQGQPSAASAPGPSSATAPTTLPGRPMKLLKPR
jgi:hypothetical protein